MPSTSTTLGEGRQGARQRRSLPRRRPGAPAAADERRAVAIDAADAGEGGNVDDRAVYSIELGGLQAGEQLVIDGKLVARIGHHPYVNLVAGLAAQADFDNRHRRSDVAKVLDRGFLRVHRYGADRNDSPPPVRE